MSLRETPYYSKRTGKNTDTPKLDFPTVCKLFKNRFNSFFDRCYFQEAFGYSCTDKGRMPGILGSDIEAEIVQRLHKTWLWPVDEEHLESYSEEDLFDVIEFFYDCVSKPNSTWYHGWNDCGWHSSEYDGEVGRAEFRAAINEIIGHYNNGYELSENGEILILAENGLEELVDAELPSYDPDNIDNRIQAAIRKFRLYRSSPDEKREAIRNLADVLEYMKPKFKGILSKSDESGLFNIANNFGIRHHTDKQRTDYDKEIWNNWMFYFYLATIHMVIASLKKHEERISQTSI
jgi:hypothetical protein